MRYKKIGISLLITLLLLIPITDVKANTNTTPDPLKLLITAFVGATVGSLYYGAEVTETVVSDFYANVNKGVQSTVSVYNDLKAITDKWVADNYISQGLYASGPLLIPKDLFKLFSREVNISIKSVGLDNVAVSEELKNFFLTSPYDKLYDYPLYYEFNNDITFGTSTNPNPTEQFNMLEMFNGVENTVKSYKIKILGSVQTPIKYETETVFLSGATLAHIYSNPSKYFKLGSYSNNFTFSFNVNGNSCTSFTSCSDSFNLYKGDVFPLIKYNLVADYGLFHGVQTNLKSGSYGYMPLAKTYTATGGYKVFKSLQTLQAELNLADQQKYVDTYPDSAGNTPLSNKIYNNVTINNFNDAMSQNSSAVLNPNSWADSKTDDDTVIPSYTGSLPTLSNGVLTNSDGSVYPLPQFPTPSIDVSWDILATLQNLFSWLASVLKWIVDMGIYGLYMILAQLGLTQYFNIVIEFFKSIFDLLLSGFKFLFKAIQTIPDFFKFIIALLALIFDSILKFINLIITLIIHTFYNLINSALLSYTSITRLLPSPLNYVANATVSLVTSFLTFKVIKNIIGGLRS